MRTLTLAGILAITVAGAALAQATPPGTLFISPMGQPFRADEHTTGMQQWFAQADTDHDGKISFAEFVADADTFFPRADANHDGALISTESTAFWRAEAPEIIDYNVDNDAPLDPNTPAAPTSHVHKPRQTGASWGGLLNSTGTTNPRRGSHGERLIGAQPFDLLEDAEPIMSCDTNFDRRVDKTEFDQCAARRFVQLDKNHDGFFSVDEAPDWAKPPVTPTTENH